jgi:hypothetical protein
MALTFTCTISIAQADRASVRDMLIGALGCNIAWGLCRRLLLYILMTKTVQERGFTILNFVRRSKIQVNRSGLLPMHCHLLLPMFCNPTKWKKIRQRILQLPESKVTRKQKFRDYKIAVGIFFLVLLSTFSGCFPLYFYR